MIDYKASGKLVSAVNRMQQIDGKDLYWIISDISGHKTEAILHSRFVLSAYIDGDTCWLQGHYFETLEEATAKLSEFVQHDVEVMSELRE